MARDHAPRVVLPDIQRRSAGDQKTSRSPASQQRRPAALAHVTAMHRSLVSRSSPPCSRSASRTLPTPTPARRWRPRSTSRGVPPRSRGSAPATRSAPRTASRAVVPARGPARPRGPRARAGAALPPRRRRGRARPRLVAAPPGDRAVAAHAVSRATTGRRLDAEKSGRRRGARPRLARHPPPAHRAGTARRRHGEPGRQHDRAHHGRHAVPSASRRTPGSPGTGTCSAWSCPRSSIRTATASTSPTRARTAATRRSSPASPGTTARRRALRLRAEARPRRHARSRLSQRARPPPGRHPDRGRGAPVRTTQLRYAPRPRSRAASSPRSPPSPPTGPRSRPCASNTPRRATRWSASTSPDAPALDPTAAGRAWVDVDGDALPDLLEGQPGAWRHRRNLGGRGARPLDRPAKRARRRDRTHRALRRPDRRRRPGPPRPAGAGRRVRIPRRRRGPL
jgi:hypothetical protein